MKNLRQDARTIIDDTLQSVMPYEAVRRALAQKQLSDVITVIAVGKAAWTMAKAASELLGTRIKKGVVLTKYEHSQGEISGFDIIEGGHPVLDENGIRGTEVILDTVKQLTEQDTVLFLLSGGGSALFEKPAGNLQLSDLKAINQQLLACGADIVEINTIRKHLSAVKGGRFAKLCAPAFVYTIALSDILGDRVDAIASGPTAADTSTVQQAMEIVQKYHLQLSDHMMEQLQKETPKQVENGEIVVTGSVSQLCQAAEEAAQRLGYTPFILTTMLDCEAREAGRFLGSIAKSRQKGEGIFSGKCAIICGGETVVHLTGTGKGGRNQELALAAAPYLEDMDGVLLAAVGSDGTDGPTDAAGGMVDGQTMQRLREKNISIDQVLSDNNAYDALRQVDGLIMTGPTGTNVNDLYFLLME